MDGATVAQASSLRLNLPMTSTTDILLVVLGQFPLPANVFPPEGKFWLTLYLAGSPDSYAEARPALESAGWRKLEYEAGFAYPKKEVPNKVERVRDALSAVVATCNKSGMCILHVDADTALDVEKSTFRTLYSS